MQKNIKTMTYQEYINTANDEEMVFINELENQCVISGKDLEKLNLINKELNVIIITATACKDSATIMPFLIKLANLNSNIKIRFIKKVGNEELLTEMSKECKVPSIMIVDECGNTLRKFIEFPKGVKDILIANPKEKTQEIIDSMRSGKYNDLIQRDLIAFLTGEDYDYISFQRQDK